eukprot:scaffold59348_cov69-Phaeocystis_antarctica.AAC.2
MVYGIAHIDGLGSKESRVPDSGYLLGDSGKWRGLPFMPPHPQCNLKLERQTVSKDVTNTHHVFAIKLPIHPNSQHLRPRCSRPGSLACCATCLLRLPRGLACAPRVLSALPARSPCRLPADSMRSPPCTSLHTSPAHPTMCGHDGP